MVEMQTNLSFIYIHSPRNTDKNVMFKLERFVVSQKKQEEESTLLGD